MYAGTGIYSLPEAARLIGAPAQDIRRWLYGYQYTRTVKGERVQRFSEPLWRPQTAGYDLVEQAIGFHDLLEVRFIRAFVQHGVPLIVVRRCLESARVLYGIDYPFTTLQFKTDGRTIFGEAIETLQDEASLIDLKSRQLVFKNIITPSLYSGIEYDGRHAKKWYPSGKKAHIVLDPARQFGSPIVEGTGTPTDALYASYLAEGRDEGALTSTASTYRVPVRLVRSAVVFEDSLRRVVH